MSVTAGTISLVGKTANQVKLACTAATGGTGPYTYQWYMSQTTGFSPGGGNILTGETELSLTKDALIPHATYYFKLRATDTGASNATSDSAQFAVTTNGMEQSPNQFAQSSIVGMLDLRFNYDTISAQIDVSEIGVLYPGSAVKVVENSGGGVPKVVACSAENDDVFGFINYDIKSRQYVAGDMVELSQDGNVMYLYAAGPIGRGKQVTLSLVAPGTVDEIASGDTIVGWAYDQAIAYGSLIRVRLTCPSFQTAS